MCWTPLSSRSYRALQGATAASVSVWGRSEEVTYEPPPLESTSQRGGVCQSANLGRHEVGLLPPGRTHAVCHSYSGGGEQIDGLETGANWTIIEDFFVLTLGRKTWKYRFKIFGLFCTPSPFVLCAVVWCYVIVLTVYVRLKPALVTGSAGWHFLPTSSRLHRQTFCIM